VIVIATPLDEQHRAAEPALPQGGVGGGDRQGGLAQPGADPDPRCGQAPPGPAGSDWPW
jgi:hypothetical protein